MSVFTGPTNLDYANALRNVFERKKLLTYNEYLLRMPQIFSHVYVEIRQDVDLQKENPDFFDYCYRVRLKGGKQFCDASRCNMHYPRGKTCTPRDVPKIFKSGNSDVIACQGACFPIKDSESKYHGSNNYWSDRCDACLLIHQEAYMLGIDDYWRANKGTIVPHVNTIGTGFDVDPHPYVMDTGDETIHFRLNSYYCENFLMTLENGECTDRLDNKIIGFLIGNYLYRMIEYSFVELAHGSDQWTVKQPQLPPTGQIPNYVAEWNNCVNHNAFCINPNITLGDMGISKGTPRHLFWTTEYGGDGQGNGGRLVEPLIITRNVESIVSQNQYRVPIKQQEDSVPNHLKYIETGERQIDEYLMLGLTSSFPTEYSNELFSSKSTMDIVSDIILDILRSFASHEFLLQMFGEIGIRVMLKTMVKYVGPAMITTGAKILNRQLGVFFFRAFTMEFLSRALVSTALKMVGVAIRTFATITLSVLPIIDIILVGTAIAEVLLTVYDPFYMNNLQGQGYVDGLSKLEFELKRKIWGFRTMEYTPIMFVTMWKNAHEEIIDLKNHVSIQQRSMIVDDDSCTGKLSAFSKKDIIFNPPSTGILPSKVVKDDDFTTALQFRFEYLLTLKVNSNGSRIDWSQASGGDDDDVKLSNQLKTFSDRNPDQILDFSLYTSKMNSRINTINMGLYLLAVSSLASGIIVFFTNKTIHLFFISVILLIIAIFVQMSTFYRNL